MSERTPNDLAYTNPDTLLGDLRVGLCSSGLCKQLRAVAATEIERLTQELANIQHDSREYRETMEQTASLLQTRVVELTRERDDWKKRHDREHACHAANLKEQMKVEAERDRLRAALGELHALVWGECSSILNEDSGGDAHLDIEIRSLIAERSQSPSERNCAHE